MNFGIQMNRSERAARREGGHRRLFASSCQPSLRYRTQYLRHSDEVRDGHRQLEVLIDRSSASVDGRADAPDRVVAGSRLDQPAVHREAALREQPGLLGQRHHFGEERLDHFTLEQLVAIGEHRVILHRIVDRQPHEPAKQRDSRL